MTPSQYKARYEKIVVLLEDGRTQTVRVNQYRLKSLNYTAAGNDAFMSMLRKHGIDMELCVYSEFGMVRVDPNLSKAEDSFKRRSGIDVVISEESAAGQKVRWTVESRIGSRKPDLFVG